LIILETEFSFILYLLSTQILDKISLIKELYLFQELILEDIFYFLLANCEDANVLPLFNQSCIMYTSTVLNPNMYSGSHEDFHWTFDLSYETEKKYLISEMSPIGALA